MATRSRQDEERKIRYREEARGIVRDDREKRKYGVNNDHAGAIARAMERAYRDGVEAGRNPQAPIEVKQASPDEPMAWEAIPPRPRSAFWHIALCNGMAKMEDEPRPAVLVRGQARPFSDDICWRLYSGEDLRDSYGDRTIQPLIRLGLLTTIKDRPDCLVMTRKGLQTWFPQKAKEDAELAESQARWRTGGLGLRE